MKLQACTFSGLDAGNAIPAPVNETVLEQTPPRLTPAPSSLTEKDLEAHLRQGNHPAQAEIYPAVPPCGQRHPLLIFARMFCPPRDDFCPKAQLKLRTYPADFSLSSPCPPNPTAASPQSVPRYPFTHTSPPPPFPPRCFPPARNLPRPLVKLFVPCRGRPPPGGSGLRAAEVTAEEEPSLSPGLTGAGLGSAGDREGPGAEPPRPPTRPSPGGASLNGLQRPGPAGAERGGPEGGYGRAGSPGGDPPVPGGQRPPHGPLRAAPWPRATGEGGGPCPHGGSSAVAPAHPRPTRSPTQLRRHPVPLSPRSPSAPALYLAAGRRPGSTAPTAAPAAPWDL